MNNISRLIKYHQKSCRSGFRFSVIFLLILLVFVVLLSTGRSSDAKKRINCFICRENISGEYWDYGKGRIICNKCYKNLPKCTQCKFPSKNLTAVENGRVCPECLDKFQKCSKCAKAIIRYWTLKDNNGKTLILCESCSIRTSPECLLCSTSLHGKKFWVLKSSAMDREGNYCEKCRTIGKECFTCGLLVHPDAPLLTGNRRICNYCRKTSLKTESEYRQILRVVDDIFKNKLGLFHRQVHDFKIVDFPTLKQLRIQQNFTPPEGSGENLGLFVSRKKYLNNFSKKTRVISEPGTIYVLDNLPPEVAYAVIAHEYAHAWHEERLYESKDPLIMEGFAEWAAYHVLLEKKMIFSAENMKKNDTIYGRGLRMMLDYEKNKGRKALLEYVTN
jgi:hypothetical protein